MNSVVGTFFTPLLNRWIERQTRSCRGRGAITFPANVVPKDGLQLQAFLSLSSADVHLRVYSVGRDAHIGVFCVLRSGVFPKS